jgi:hypothetical protein
VEGNIDRQGKERETERREGNIDRQAKKSDREKRGKYR